MRAVLGGTFSALHRGHETLFERAFEVADEVHVGLTTDEFAAGGRGYTSPPYAERERALRDYLAKFGKVFEIFPISDPYGPAVGGDYDVLVVSAETRKRAWEINALRTARGLKPLKIEIVPLVFAEDLIPLKSRRVLAGEVSESGERLTPVRVRVGSTNPVKINAVKNVFEKVLPVELTVEGVEVHTGVPRQPFGAQAFRGALNRALAAVKGVDFGVGIEAGLVYSPEMDDFYDVQYCVVADSTGLASAGHGPGFQYPRYVVEEVLRGKEVGEVMSRITGVEELGRKQGAIGHLSKGILDREGLTEQAVLMALIPRVNAEEYSIEQFYRSYDFP